MTNKNRFLFYHRILYFKTHLVKSLKILQTSGKSNVPVVTASCEIQLCFVTIMYWILVFFIIIKNVVLKNKMLYILQFMNLMWFCFSLFVFVCIVLWHWVWQLLIIDNVRFILLRMMSEEYWSQYPNSCWAISESRYSSNCTAVSCEYSINHKYMITFVYSVLATWLYALLVYS